MTEKKDLWLVFLLGLITCGIYNMVVAITALKRIYKINGNEQGFNKRIVIWIFYYASYYILFIAMYIFVIVGTLMLESATFEEAGFILAGLGSVVWMISWLAIPIIGLILYYQEFNVLTEVSNKNGIKTTPGYKIAVILLGAANAVTASLILQARLNKLLDLQNNNTSTPNAPVSTAPQAPTEHIIPNTPVVQNEATNEETSKDLLDF